MKIIKKYRQIIILFLPTFIQEKTHGKLGAIFMKFYTNIDLGIK